LSGRTATSFHADVSAPAETEFERYEIDGIELFQDAQLEPPLVWKLQYSRFPRPHLRAYYNAVAFSGGGIGYGSRRLFQSDET
jgi:hypothetical protein